MAAGRSRAEEGGRLAFLTPLPGRLTYKSSSQTKLENGFKPLVCLTFILNL